MTAPLPSARSVRHALGILERLPTEALAVLAERLIERIDAADGDLDLEEEVDCCEAGECGGVKPPPDCNAGDPTDAEPDDEDHAHGSLDEPLFGSLPARGSPEPVRYIERAGWTGHKRGRWEFVERVRT